MSLYALPGLLFPPIETRAGSHETESSGSSNLNNTNAGVNQPLNEENHELKEGESSVSDASGGASTNEERLSSNVADTIKRGGREVWIAVRQAKIDPVRLVQSLTGSRGKAKSVVKSTLEQGTDASQHSTTQGSDVPASGPLHGDVASGSVRQDSQCLKRDDNTKECTPHEEAIQFELTINFNGRSYKATRTLPRIIQLRNDLIRELNHHRKMLMRRRRKGQLLRHPDACPNPGRKPVHEDDDSLSLSSEEDSLADMDDTNTANVFDVTIPELPCISDKGSPATATTGFVGRGFTMLHALLRSYCPAMERWLLTVTSIISPNDSPTLTKFLWEPLSSSTSTFSLSSLSGESKVKSTPTLRLSHSFSGLDSIQEIEFDDGLVQSEDYDDNNPPSNLSSGN